MWESYVATASLRKAKRSPSSHVESSVSQPSPFRPERQAALVS